MTHLIATHPFAALFVVAIASALVGRIVGAVEACVMASAGHADERTPHIEPADFKD